MIVSVPNGAPLVKLLVVGLGNLPYPATRHSLGHYIVDALADNLGIRLASSRDVDGFMGTQVVQLPPVSGKEVSITLLKPKPLMNISGPPVRKALRYHNIPHTHLVVIHDSLQHRPCYLSPKFGGSAEGHRGILDVISSLGNDKNFHRLRVGIGRGEGDIKDYVLGRLSGFEKEFWGADGQGVDQVMNALSKISQKGS